MVSLSNYTLLLILDLVEQLNIEQLSYLYNQQNNFHKNLLLRTLPLETSEKVKAVDLKYIDQSKMLAEIEDILLNLYPGYPIKVGNLMESNMNYISDYQLIDKLKILWYQFLSRKVTDVNTSFNFYITKKVILYIADFARAYGLMPLDFIFLREYGFKEIFFYELLLAVTCGRSIEDLLVKTNLQNTSVLNNKYYKLVIAGLTGVQEGLSARKINTLLL